MKHTVICEIIGERSTLSREHFLYKVRVVCISFWTTIVVFFFFLLCVSCTRPTRTLHLYLYQTNSSTDDVRNTPGAFSCVYCPRRHSLVRLLQPPIHDTTGSFIVMLLPAAADVLFINFYASSLLGPSYSLERRRRNPSCRARASETLFYY